MDNIEEKPMSENDRKKEYLKTYRRMALREKSFGDRNGTLFWRGGK